MHCSSPLVLFAVLFFAGAVGCATTTPRDDASPPADGSATTTDGAAPAPAATAPVDDDDDDGIGAVTVTVTYPDGQQQTHRWGYAGGGQVNGITNLALKPNPTTLAPNVGIVLMRPVTQGRSFAMGASDGAAEGMATLMLDAQRGYQVATGTLQFSRVERLAPGALEVDGVLSGECASMTTPGDTVVVEVTFRGAIIAG